MAKPTAWQRRAVVAHLHALGDPSFGGTSWVSESGHWLTTRRYTGGFARFDHRKDDDEVIGMLGIIGTSIKQRPDRAEAATALGRVAAGRHQTFGLGAVVDHRADHAVGAGIQHLAEDAGLQPGHAHDRDRRRRRDALEHGHGHLVVDHAVLHVDRHGVPALMGHGLGRE